MIDRSDSITINLPVEEVFAYVTDTTNDPAWHTDVLEVRKTSEGPVGMGTKWHLGFKPFMGVSEGKAEVVAFEPNRTEVQQAVAGPMQTTLTYLFEPAEGGTRFTRRVQINVSGWMRLMQPLMRVMPEQERRLRGKPQAGARAGVAARVASGESPPHDLPHRIRVQRPGDRGNAGSN